MDMTMQQLRMLREVAQVGTISAAASSLGYTPSAVSQQLAGLERAAGVSVLERVGRNVVLTDAGRLLVGHAEDLLARLEAAHVAVEELTSRVSGRLVLGAFESVTSALLPDALDLLARRYPDLELRTVQMDPGAALDAVARGDLDASFVLSYGHVIDAPRDELVRTDLTVDPFRLVTPTDGSWREPSVELSAVASAPFIASSPELSCGRCVIEACRAAGFEPDVVHQLDDYPTVLRLVAAGHGVALVPDLGLEDVPDGVRVLDIDPPLHRTVQLAQRRVSAGRPSLVALADVLAEVVARRRIRRPIGLAG